MRSPSTTHRLSLCILAAVAAGCGNPESIPMGEQPAVLETTTLRLAPESLSQPLSIQRATTFIGTASSAIRKVRFTVDDWKIGEATPRDGRFSLTYTFTGGGSDRKLVAAGFDSAGKQIATFSAKITVAPKPLVCSQTAGCVSLTSKTRQVSAGTPLALAGVAGPKVVDVQAVLGEDILTTGKVVDGKFAMEITFDTPTRELGLVLRGLDANGETVAAATYAFDIAKPPPPVEPGSEMERYERTAERIGLVKLEKPADHDPQTYYNHISYFRQAKLPDSMRGVPSVPRALTEEEGRRFYFDGLLPLVETANTPSPATSEFEAAIKEGRVVEPPCATTNSQVLERAALKAGLPWVAEIFANPRHYYPTHNNEIQLQRLGWSYYLKEEHVSPPASVGAWSRYTFVGVPGHTGHIFVIFKDMGMNARDLVGDNTRRSDEPHGHPYRPEGKTVGFWLPPGVYPMRR